MAKSDIKKKRSPEIEVVWKENVPEATYFQSNGYSIVAKVENGSVILTRNDSGSAESIVVSPNDTARLKDSFRVKHSDTLLKALGKRFALKEPHNCALKIQLSLQRRGIPFVKK